VFEGDVRHIGVVSDCDMRDMRGYSFWTLFLCE
jgi:hypothetical protein